MTKQDTHICSDITKYLKRIYGEEFEFTKFVIRKYKNVVVVTITCKAEKEG